MLPSLSVPVQEERITAFLDRLEGETLGRMLDYLSTELTHSLLTPKVGEVQAMKQE
jgi:hypothetical protein